MERLPTSHPKAQRKDVPEMRSKSVQPLFSHMAKKPRSCQRRRRTSSDRAGGTALTLLRRPRHICAAVVDFFKFFGNGGTRL